MPVTRQPISRGFRREEGFTLIEVLIAIGLLTIGLVGVGAMLAVQAGGLSSSSSVGLAAVNRANLLSTATMLAQEKIELTKNKGYAAVLLATEIEDYAPAAISLTGYPNFKRVTTVADGPDTVTTKKVTVEVFFKPQTESGAGAEASVKLVTIIGQHP